jgi:hypothetical protein
LYLYAADPCQEDCYSNLSTTQRYFRVKPDRLAREYFAVMEFIRQTSPV